MRRGFLSGLFGLPALGWAAPAVEPARRSRILIKSAWGSADPTQASFPFHHARAFAEAGHPVQIFLLGEAVSLMREPVARSVVPVGWPPLAEALAKTLEHKIPVHVRGACAKARGVFESELPGKNATFANPAIFVGLVEWADKVLTE
jgi:sulfur relay (sulfurtransferase) complex TusBCD TusD component (DsrE family)